MPRFLSSLLALLVCAPFAVAQVTFSNTTYNTPTIPSGIVSGDFNRDGKPDMAVLNGQNSSDSSVTIFLATTAGHFPSSGVSYPVHAFPADIRTADINNDGNLDLVISFNSSPVLSILWGHANGTFTKGPDVTLPGTVGVHGFDLGDFNHDGKIDIADIEHDSDGFWYVRSLLGSGTGTFSTKYKIEMVDEGRSILARDLNGDGNLDLILTRTNNVLLFGGDGTGRFPEFSHFITPAHCDPSACSDSLPSIVVADFNNDQQLDFAVLQAHNCGSACGSNDVYIYKNTGGFNFTRVFDLPIGPVAGGMLLASDFNGDGNIDLMNVNGDVWQPGNIYAQGAGNGTFTIQSNSERTMQTAQMVARDMNLDSRHDVIGTEWMDDTAIVGLNTSSYVNCAPPSSAAIAAKICAPVAGASAASPVLIKASGNSPAGIVRLEVWVDGVKKYQKWNDQINKRIAMSSGSHRVTVVAVDMYTGTAKTSVTINVP